MLVLVTAGGTDVVVSVVVEDTVERRVVVDVSVTGSAKTTEVDVEVSVDTMVVGTVNVDVVFDVLV